VRPGDRVKRGQAIARAGSSGTTGGPHLHFQVMDRPSIVFSDGLPYVFDKFDLTGQTPPLAAMLRYYDTLERVPIDTRNAGTRRNAYPMSGDVVKFAPTLRQPSAR
jgi:murein DD-endopeptidase MepM/ murein hydrolase activator NlpD